MIHAQEESMSGRKKLFRRTVVFVNRRRGRGRRKVRTRIARRASMQFALGMIIMAIGLGLGFLLNSLLH